MSKESVQKRMKDMTPPENWLRKTSRVLGKCLVTLKVILVKIIAECSTVTKMKMKTPAKPSHLRRPATQPAITPENTRACAKVRPLCCKAGRNRNSPSSSFCCIFPFDPAPSPGFALDFGGIASSDRA
eukprot:CAMPEP_0115501122 /NCGR_PEP_ID=MMETSP0271-20121206/68228_1 /TAXON_ID=71861 /ORGANISM="Scrippsiella trochoidea, Strain CCMP3099" /LENGTH=127 /DNA_ID=CAMNT_0002930033 /DNA_START=27 /DNA_END=406 /DNA_ORIENTATION=-